MYNYNRCDYIAFPMMETICDHNGVLHNTIVFKYLCFKCRKNFSNKKEYDNHYCKKGRFVSNE